MTIKRMITIVFNRHRVLTIRGEPQGLVSWCPTCNEQVRMLTPEQAAQLLPIDQRVIFRAIEAGEIHFIEAPHILVCLESIHEFLNRETAAREGDGCAVEKTAGKQRKTD